MSLPLMILVWIPLIASLAGCSSRGPVVKMPDTQLPIIKTYRSFTVHATTSRMKKTGVHLQEGDLYSLFAAGEIKPSPYRKITPKTGHLIAREGEGNYILPLDIGWFSGTRSALKTGELHLGYIWGHIEKDGRPTNPERYHSNTGAFQVDIVVWAREDYEAIIEVIKDLAQKDPENQALKDGVARAKWAQLVAEIQKTAEAIEATKKEIAALKSAEKPSEAAEETPTDPPAVMPPVSKIEKVPPAAAAPAEAPETAHLDPEKEARIAALESRLAELQGMLAGFEKMKKDLEVEQRRTTQLAQKKVEMAQREKDLLARIQEGSKSPPVVVIASPEDGSKVEVKIIGLRGVVEDDREIVKIEIFINGRPLEKDSDRGIQVVGDAGRGRLSFLEQIPLQEGENHIRVRAVNTDGLATEKMLTLQRVYHRKNIWAVVIGINDYAHISPLQYAVNDARAFYRYLVDQMGILEENIKLLLDEDAELSRLRTVLGTELKNSAGEEDMVIVFFAGHGAMERDVMSPDGDGLEKYLLPHGADMKNLYATALPMREIQHIFNRIRSQRLVFVVDSCYSGASGGRTISIAGLRANISDAFMERIASGKGRVILSASGPNEVSQEDEKLGHGVFTYYLLEGLRGPADADGDGLITVDEAYSYASRHVPQATGQEQNPVKKGSVEGQLIIGVRP